MYVCVLICVLRKPTALNCYKISIAYVWHANMHINYFCAHCKWAIFLLPLLLLYTQTLLPEDFHLLNGAPNWKESFGYFFRTMNFHSSAIFRKRNNKRWKWYTICTAYTQARTYSNIYTHTCSYISTKFAGTEFSFASDVGEKVWCCYPAGVVAGAFSWEGVQPATTPVMKRRVEEWLWASNAALAGCLPLWQLLDGTSIVISHLNYPWGDIQQTTKVHITAATTRELK